MKNIFNFIIFFLIFQDINSQTIINLDSTHEDFPKDGVYYKDVNNYFGPYTGTWNYVNGSTEMTVSLKKINKYYNDKYYSDLLIGDMRYVKNGIVQFDNLSRISAELDPNIYDLFGDFLLKPNHFPKCPECLASERRISMTFYGVNNNNRGGEIVLQRITTPGQPDTIKLTIKYLMEIDIEGEPAPLPPKIEGLEFVLTKQ